MNFSAHQTAIIDAGSNIGAGTKIWHFSHIMKDSIIGECCNIGQNVVISPGVILGNNVKIKNNVSVYTGVICEEVITKPVKDFALMIGNPARQIGWVSEHGHRINFEETGIGVCPETGQEYSLKNEMKYGLNRMKRK